MIGSFLDTWHHHALNAIPYLEQGYKLGLEIGNIEYASYTQLANFVYFYTGKKLTTFYKSLQQYIDFSALIKNKPYYFALSFMGNIIKYLQAGPEAAKDLQDNLHAVMELDNKTLQAIVSATYSMFSYLIDDYPNAQKYTDFFQKIKIAIKGGIIHSSIGWLASSLLICRSYENATKKSQRKYLKTLLSYQRKFKKWASYSPDNFEFMYLWLSAVIERLQNHISKAGLLYEEAMEVAQQNGYINFVGLICESAAQWYLDLKLFTSAEAYIKRAYLAFLRWGATYKCQLLANKYREFITHLDLPDSASLERSTSLTSMSFDISTIMKSSQAISSEIELGKLLNTLLKLSLENAGAKKGALLFEQEKELIVVANSKKNNIINVDLEGIRLSDYEALPKTIIYYVWHSNENHLINDQSQMEPFLKDPYIEANKPKSILCVPILLHGNTSGYLYLENRLTPHAFTPKQLQTLRLLGGQSAISLENAKLYSAIGRFVPYEFLRLLNKSSLAELKLGDHLEREMSILFCDIRNFTTLSEKITPAETFQFINEFFGYLEPDIKKHHGFVDKFIGDAIMALFERADDAVKAALDMLRSIEKFNKEMTHYPTTKIGIGINTGIIMLGIIGQKNRIEGSVLGDPVNVASRIQNLTKEYGETLLISDTTKQYLNPKTFQLTAVGEVTVRGKTKPVTLFRVSS